MQQRLNTETLRKKLKAFESWVWKRLLKISGTGKITNAEVRKQLVKKNPS